MKIQESTEEGSLIKYSVPVKWYAEYQSVFPNQRLECLFEWFYKNRESLSWHL